MKQTIAAWMAAFAALGTYSALADLTDLQKANKLLQLDEDDRDRRALQNVAQDWNREDAKGLFSLAVSQTDNLDDEEEEFFVIAGTRFAQQHPEDALVYIDGAFRLMRNGDDDSPKAYLLRSMVKQLLFNDAGKVVQWIKAKEDRKELIFKVEGDLLVLLSQYAPEYVLERGKADSEVLMYGRPFAALAKKDWKAAARYFVDSKDDEFLKHVGVGQLAAHLSSHNAEAALVWLHDLDAKLGEEVRLEWMKDRNPSEARQFLEAKLKQDGSLDEKFFAIVRGWASKDPEGVRQWCEALPEDRGQLLALGAVAEVWPSKDAEAAGKWIESLPKGNVKNRGLRAMSNALRQDDPAAAIPWAEQLPDRERESELRSIFTFWRRGDTSQKMKLMEASSLSEDEKAQLRRRDQFDPRSGKLRGIMELSRRDPEAAKKQLAEMPEGREREMIEQFIDRAAANDSSEMQAVMAKMRNDPKGAMAVLERLPDGPTKESMRQNIQMRIDQIDPEAARKRLAALPEGREREREIRRSAMMVMRTNPEGAASIAELMEPPRRDQTLEMVYQQWLKKDPVEAGAALRKSSLPEARKKFLQPSAGKE